MPDNLLTTFAIAIEGVQSHTDQIFALFVSNYIHCLKKVRPAIYSPYSGKEMDKLDLPERDLLFVSGSPVSHIGVGGPKRDPFYDIHMPL